MVASKSKDVAFTMMLAGTGIPGDELLLLQQQAIAKASGVKEQLINQNAAINAKAFEIVKKAIANEQMKSELTSYLKQTLATQVNSDDSAKLDDQIAIQVNQLASPWMRYFIKYNPALALEKVKCLVLALNGSKDLQVPAKENLAAIQKALAKGGNKKATTRELPSLNHLFQECKTGLPNEYGTIEQTFSPVALNEILSWFKGHL